MSKLYVEAPSKKAVNEKLAAGQAVYGRDYSIFSVSINLKVEFRTVMLDESLPDGTVIAFYTKTISGQPYATKYGQWDSAKKQVR